MKRAIDFDPVEKYEFELGEQVWIEHELFCRGRHRGVVVSRKSGTGLNSYRISFAPTYGASARFREAPRQVFNDFVDRFYYKVAADVYSIELSKVRGSAPLPKKTRPRAIIFEPGCNRIMLTNQK